MPVSLDYVRKTNDERFWAKVRLPTDEGCWPWLGGKTKDGYGSFWTGEWKGPRRPITTLAHRWAYERFVGEIPDGLCVLHHCDNPWCVYPRHLFVGTQADNVSDCARKGRRNQIRYRKLDAERHRQIRAMHATGEFTYAELGRRFGVTYQAIRYIVGRGGHSD